MEIWQIKVGKPKEGKLHEWRKTPTPKPFGAEPLLTWVMEEIRRVNAHPDKSPLWLVLNSEEVQILRGYAKSFIPVSSTMELEFLRALLQWFVGQQYSCVPSVIYLPNDASLLDDMSKWKDTELSLAISFNWPKPG